MASRSAGWGLALALVGVLIVVACAPGLAPQGQAPYPNAQILAETDWLAQHLGDADLRILDVRAGSDYQEGHIKNALPLDMRDLTDEGAAVRGMLAPQAKVEAILGSLGIGPETTVVVYDDSGGLWAARLFWVLDYFQHPDVRILNGGFSKWVREGKPVDKVVPQVKPTRYRVNPAAERLASKEWVRQNLDAPGVVLVDARSLGEYNGKDVVAKRGGHIPGAVNLEWTRNLAAEGVWKPAQELQRMYRAVGVSQDKEVVTYCQTGVRAAHAYFTLRLLGYSRLRLYDGSWEEWGNDTSLPIEK
jgi:thiosulfate/3-mercaptopyruvate sulfurtransferase